MISKVKIVEEISWQAIESFGDHNSSEEFNFFT